MRVPVWHPARCGVVVVRFSRIARMKTSTHKVNKKMYRAGMQSILSELARLGRLQVVEEFKMDSPKTKQMVQKIKALGFR